MENRNKKIYAPFVAISFVFASIVSCHSTTAPASRPPTANAGPDQAVKVGQYVILDGSGSRRGDGDTLTYHWTADSSNPAAIWFMYWDPKITLGFTKEGTYRFRLIVNDGLSASQPDEVVVSVAPRDVAVFKDPALEIEVRLALDNPRGELTDQQLSMLDTLVAGGVFGKVSSLEGIGRCYNLQCLNLSGHNLSDITPVAQLKSLTELELDQNRILADISPLAGLTELRKLNLQLNMVSNISPLRNLTKLTFLNLMTNPITDITVLKDMTELDELWLDSSRIVSASVIAGFTKLRILWMTDCDLTDVSFLADLTELHLLHLGGNHITDISPLENCRQLERLYLDRNNIVDISALEKLTNLEVLDLQWNDISNIKPLVNNQGLGEGDGVFLTRNPLDSISVNQYIPELRARGVLVFY